MRWQNYFSCHKLTQTCSSQYVTPTDEHFTCTCAYCTLFSFTGHRIHCAHVCLQSRPSRHNFHSVEHQCEHQYLQQCECVHYSECYRCVYCNLSQYIQAGMRAADVASIYEHPDVYDALQAQTPQNRATIEAIEVSIHYTI